MRGERATRTAATPVRGLQRASAEGGEGSGRAQNAGFFVIRSWRTFRGRFQRSFCARLAPIGATCDSNRDRKTTSESLFRGEETNARFTSAFLSWPAVPLSPRGCSERCEALRLQVCLLRSHISHNKAGPRRTSLLVLVKRQWPDAPVGTPPTPRASCVSSDLTSPSTCRPWRTGAIAAPVSPQHSSFPSEASEVFGF